MNHPRFARARALGPLSVRVVLITALLAFAAAESVRAEPPCWAPAHGYRAKHGGGDCDGSHREKYKGGKHKSRHRGRGGHERDYRHEASRRDGSSSSGVSAGGLVGAAVGGYAGSKVGKGNGKLAATAAGAVGGYIVGQEVERQLTEPQR